MNEVLAFFVLRIEKRVRFLEAYDASTVVQQQHPCDWPVSHGHVFQLFQVRIPCEVPMIHGEYVDGREKKVVISSLELVHHGPFSCLHPGCEDIRVCLGHIRIVLCAERFQSK